MDTRRWKVGELATRAGVSVRTLRHYDQIGLLSPARRSESGYRLYSTSDVARLQQIRSLRALGFSLEEIRALLDRKEVSVQRVIELQIGRLKEQIALQRALCDRLEMIASRMRGAEEVSAPEFLHILELMSMVEKAESYYTQEQLETLKERTLQVGEARIRQVEAEWPELIAEVRAAMDRGADPASEPVQALARRWKALVEEFTGGDAGIAQNLQRMYEQEAAREQSGIDPALFAYIREASASSSSPNPSPSRGEGSY